MSLHFDVVVCGGGTAGAAAAIAAAREGAKTIVIERMGALGGTQTQAWVTPMMPNYLSDFKLDRGVNLDILERQSKSQPHGSEVSHADVWYDPVELARILDDVACESGVQCLFDAVLFAATRSERRIESINVATRGGNLILYGEAFVDATGDAALSVLGGAEVMGGNEDGVHQPLTLRFAMGGVDLEKARVENRDLWRVNAGQYLETGFAEAKSGPLGPKIHAAISNGILEEEDLGYFQCFTINGRPGEFAFNCPRISGLDPTDPFELSLAYQVGRQKIHRISEFMKRFIGGFANSYVSVIAPMMGIRESRRVVGEYILTAEDHVEERKFEDVVARNRYPIDIHLKSGLDYRKYPEGAWHDIPYRSLVVKGFDNLWVAGRCISADFVAQSAIRIQPVCRSLGTAAGVAAALCSASGISSQQLPYEDLAKRLDMSLPSNIGVHAEGTNSQ